jgi:hypothetical protein
MKTNKSKLDWCLRNENLGEKIMKGKIYKLNEVNFITNSNIRSMLPGDLRVARCFFYFGGSYV